MSDSKTQLTAVKNTREKRYQFALVVAVVIILILALIATQTKLSDNQLYLIIFSGIVLAGLYLWSQRKAKKRNLYEQFMYLVETEGNNIASEITTSDPRNYALPFGIYWIFQFQTAARGQLSIVCDRESQEPLGRYPYPLISLAREMEKSDLVQALIEGNVSPEQQQFLDEQYGIEIQKAPKKG